MATKREYLIDLNLAKPGRGRFSREALDALAKAESEGVVFDDTVKVGTSASSDAADHRQGPEPSRAPVPARPPQVRVRDIRSMFCEDEDGHVIEFSTCRRCAYHVSFCKCASIAMPSIGVRLLDKTTLLAVN